MGMVWLSSQKHQGHEETGLDLYYYYIADLYNYTAAIFIADVWHDNDGTMHIHMGTLRWRFLMSRA